MKKLIDILPKVAQWDSIPYASDLVCQNCEKSGFDGLGCRKPNLVGWAETNYGFQAIFECTECGSKFRFHGGDPCDDIDTFDLKMGIHFAMQCENWEELRKQINE